MLRTAAHNSATERSGRIIRAGFIAVMVLVASIALFAVVALHQAGRALDNIVYQEQQAMELQFRMLQNARERAVELYHIATTDDPFERDAHVLRFRELGGRFGGVRNELLDMELDARARELLEEQGRQAVISMGWKEEVISLAVDGRREDAIRLPVEKAVPAQDAMMATLNGLVEYQVAKTRAKAEQLQHL